MLFESCVISRNLAVMKTNEELKGRPENMYY